MNFFRKIFGLGTLLCLFAINSIASHSMGGHISYEWISGNTYRINLSFYRDCSGIAAPEEFEIDCYSASCQDTFTRILPLIDSSVGTPICPTLIGQTSCDGGNFIGYEQYLYSDILSLPSSCPDWVFRSELCCRNIAITNLLDAGNHSIYFKTTLDNLNTPFNNSINFNNLPVIVFYANHTANLNLGGTDIDGDSVVYSLVQPLSNDSTPITYVQGFSINRPMESTIPITLDLLTGFFNVHPSTLQVAAVA